MAIDWGAFVGGVAKSAAQGFEKRSADERELKMRERLAELQDKYAQEEEARKEARDKRKVDKDLSFIDYATKERVFTNSQGEELRREAAPASALEDRDMDVQSKKLGIRDKESTIEARAREQARQDESLKLERARTGATIENLRSGGGRSGGSSSSGDSESGGMDRVGLSVVDRVAANLIKSYGGKESETLTQAELWRQARAAAETAARAGRPDQAMSLFVDSLNNKPQVKGRRGR